MWGILIIEPCNASDVIIKHIVDYVESMVHGV